MALLCMVVRRCSNASVNPPRKKTACMLGRLSVTDRVHRHTRVSRRCFCFQESDVEKISFPFLSKPDNHVMSFFSARLIFFEKRVYVKKCVYVVYI